MDRLINVSVAYIPNLSLLACLEPLEKVPVGGGWWWWVVCKPILAISLTPSSGGSILTRDGGKISDLPKLS